MKFVQDTLEINHEHQRPAFFKPASHEEELVPTDDPNEARMCESRAQIGFSYCRAKQNHGSDAASERWTLATMT